MINQLITFCDHEFDQGTACNNNLCGRPKSCVNCLKAIHKGNGRNYDCQNMINHYVCEYLIKYTSEIVHALQTIGNFNKLGSLNILSIGCGPCPDLFAFQHTFPDKEINYVGYELNQLWQPIHYQISQQFNLLPKTDVNFTYGDVFQHYPTSGITSNILVLSYVLSNIHQTGGNVHNFLIRLRNEIIPLMPTGSLIILNDLNHWQLARDYFDSFLGYLNENGGDFVEKKFSFDGYAYGNRYAAFNLMAPVTDTMRIKYGAWTTSSTAQMILKKRA